MRERASSMLLVDDLLLLPFRGIGFIFREIHKKVEAELDDSPSVIQELQQLYMLLETGKISEKDFEKQEAVLLERLEQIERRGKTE
jgi:hypothetical protein